MQRYDEHRDDEPIDLGAVSEQTKGASGILDDTVGGEFQQMGLTDD